MSNQPLPPITIQDLVALADAIKALPKPPCQNLVCTLATWLRVRGRLPEMQAGAKLYGVKVTVVQDEDELHWHLTRSRTLGLKVAALVMEDEGHEPA